MGHDRDHGFCSVCLTADCASPVATLCRPFGAQRLAAVDVRGLPNVDCTQRRPTGATRAVCRTFGIATYWPLQLSNSVAMVSICVDGLTLLAESYSTKQKSFLFLNKQTNPCSMSKSESPSRK